MEQNISDHKLKMCAIPRAGRWAAMQLEMRTRVFYPIESQVRWHKTEACRQAGTGYNGSVAAVCFVASSRGTSLAMAHSASNAVSRRSCSCLVVSGDVARHIAAR